MIYALDEVWGRDYNLWWSITQRFLLQICVALEAVLLKFHAKLAQGWALIQVKFDPVQKIGIKSKGWELFHKTTVHVYERSLFYWTEWNRFIKYYWTNDIQTPPCVCWIARATRRDTCFDAGLYTSWSANVSTDSTVTGKYSVVAACMLLVFCFCSRCRHAKTRVLDRVTFTNRHLLAWLLT